MNVKHVLLACWLVSQSAWDARAGDGFRPGTNTPTVITVIGAPGEAEYGTQFSSWADAWKQLAAKGDARFVSIGLREPSAGVGATNDLQLLKQALAAEPKDGLADLWLVLLGHGTYDGRDAKFNLHGPDLTAADLALMLHPIQRPVAVVACFSSSGAFIPALSASNRVVVAATRSGHEQNYSRFGQFMGTALDGPEADLDKDGQTSLFEAFLTSSRQVEEYYKAENRLATEHPLIEDNGDGLGTPADWFRGLRAVKKPMDSSLPDGLFGHQFHMVRGGQDRQLTSSQLARRNYLELDIARLRESKSKLTADEYYDRLERLLMDLARIYETSSKP